MKNLSLIYLLLFTFLFSCGSDDKKPHSSSDENVVKSNQKNKKVKGNLWVIFCDFPQDLDSSAENKKDHSDQLYDRISSIVKRINDKMSTKENRNDKYSIKVYPLYDYTSNAAPLGTFICSEKKFINGDLTSKKRIRECKTKLKNDFKKFIKNSSSSGQIRIVNSLKTLGLIGNQINTYDKIEIFYVSNLLERVFQPDKTKGEFNFVDGNNFVDPLFVKSAIDQIESDASPLVKIITDQNLANLKGSKVHILPLSDFQIENKANVSLSDIKKFWINFFKKAGLDCLIYDTVEEIDL